MADLTMAIIRRPTFGAVGHRGVRLSFSTYVSESSAADQSLDAETAAAVLEQYQVEDVARLDGKPCWVDTSKPGRIIWAKPLVLK